MHAAQTKIVQYLNEAEATEQALIRVLQSQLAMTPRGSYRTALETHLGETRDHAARVAGRLRALDAGSNPLAALVGLAETVAGQVIALGKTPLDILRGTSGAEKVLKNAKDAAASEALEIATYTAIERLAAETGDLETEALAASIRADEEQMLDRVLLEIPELTDAVVARELRDLRQSEPWPGYDDLSANEVKEALEASDDEQAGRVLLYERANRARPGVLKAAERERTLA